MGRKGETSESHLNIRPVLVVEGANIDGYLNWLLFGRTAMMVRSIKPIRDMGRNKYHVTKDSDGWKGKREGGDRSSVKAPTKEEAVKRTIEIAKKQGNSQVIIHKGDGKIQEERTYPRSSDPHPPKG